jgi:hypothetical protein
MPNSYNDALNYVVIQVLLSFIGDKAAYLNNLCVVRGGVKAWSRVVNSVSAAMKVKVKVKVKVAL